MNPDEILRNTNILSNSIRRRLELQRTGLRQPNNIENEMRTIGNVTGNAVENIEMTNLRDENLNEYIYREFYSNGDGIPRFSNLMNFFNESFEGILEMTTDISRNMSASYGPPYFNENDNLNNLLAGFSTRYGFEEFVPMYAELINNTNNYNNLENVKIVLSKEDFEKKIKDIEKDEERGECGICKENESNLMLKECNHIFCKECIETWLTKYDVKCPICRKDTREIKDN